MSNIILFRIPRVKYSAKICFNTLVKMIKHFNDSWSLWVFLLPPVIQPNYVLLNQLTCHFESRNPGLSDFFIEPHTPLLPFWFLEAWYSWVWPSVNKKEAVTKIRKISPMQGLTWTSLITQNEHSSWAEEIKKAEQEHSSSGTSFFPNLSGEEWVQQRKTECLCEVLGATQLLR